MCLFAKLLLLLPQESTPKNLSGTIQVRAYIYIYILLIIHLFLWFFLFEMSSLHHSSVPPCGTHSGVSCSFQMATMRRPSSSMGQSFGLWKNQSWLFRKQCSIAIKMAVSWRFCWVQLRLQRFSGSFSRYVAQGFLILRWINDLHYCISGWILMIKSEWA